MKLYHDGQAGGFDSVHVNHQLETLEPRVLLTTLFGGDVFEYIDARGQTVRITVTGDAIVELIGGDVNTSLFPNYNDPGNVLNLGDLPGYIYSSTLGRTGAINGGLNGADGVQTVGSGRITLVDAILGSVSADEINLHSLATRHTATGTETWAINTVTRTIAGTEETFHQLIRFNYPATGNAPVVGMVIDHLALDATVTEISAAAFDPRVTSNDLYFIETHEDGRQVLRRVNVGNNPAAPVVTLDAAGDYSRQLSAGGQTDRKVTAMAFDQVTADDPLTGGVDESRFDLVIFATGSRTVEGAATPSGQIQRYVDMSGTGDFIFSGSATSRWVVLKGEQVADATGIAFVSDNATATENHVYVTTPGGLLKVDLSSGLSQMLGGLVDPNDSRDTPRGGAVSDLTWDRNRLNPFTSEMGVLVGVDSATSDLIYIDHRPRFDQADLFAIYVSQASENASISITVVEALNPEDPKHWTQRHELPYVDSIGAIRVFDSEAGEYVLVSAPTGTGGVLIGALTEEVSDTIEDENLHRILQAYLEGSLGVRPDGMNDVNAGIVVAPSMVEYYMPDTSTWADRMLGLNLDLISAMAINRHGKIAVVDSDQRDANGNATGDQLAFIDRLTGQGQSLVDIFELLDPLDPLSEVKLTGVSALAYGFADMSQVETEADQELYTVIGSRFGILSDTGEFTALADLTAITGLASFKVRSMAFAAGADINGHQRLYILADPDGVNGIEEAVLYQVEYTVDLVTGAIDAVIALNAIGGPTLADMGDMTFDGTGRLLAVDRTAGRLAQINTTTGNVTHLSPAGSLRSTVGGLAFDFQGSQVLVVDNVTGQGVISNEGANAESAALMRLLPQATGQSIGSILVAGTLLGEVEASGSIVTLYAGWMLPESITVQGDLRSLISASEIGKGSSPETNLPRTDINVMGRVGRIFAEGNSNFQLEAYNQNTGVNLTAEQMSLHEVEAKIGDVPEGATAASVAFRQFRLYNGQMFFNDTIETAQLLGTIASGEPGEPDVIRVEGTLHNNETDPDEDIVDFYSLALMAGQTIAIRLEGSGLPVGVYDPDGRLIASDLGVVDGSLVIKADRPGLYTIGVGSYSEMVEPVGVGRFSYTLVVENAGTMTVGGIDIGGFFQNQMFGNVFHIEGGDFGALRVADSLLFDGPEDMPTAGVMPQDNDIRVVNGSLRAVIAGQIGNAGSAHANVWGLNVNVTGDVGLVAATTGILSMPDSYIGGDVQMIAGVGQVFLRLYVDGGIGNIHAGSMPSFEGANVSVLHVNYDGIGQDGIIDLIDVQGDLGTSLHGGVQITTGPGGNVRYMRVGGSVYQDTQFSGGDAGVLTGRSITVQDDSGASVQMAATYDGELEVTTYGIRGSGGSVIVKVVSTTGLVAHSITGLNLRPAEISEIVVSSAGNDVTVNPLFNTVTLGITEQPVTVTLTGASALDVFSITGGGFDSIRNMTVGGELVNITARSVGLLYAAGSIGIAKQHSGAAVLSREVIHDTFPFSRQRNAVRLGDAMIIQAGTSLGNIIADSSLGGTGTIGDLQANCDGVNTTGGFEGISGAVYASGDIFRINIGEGVAHAGSGYMAHAGIFVEGKIQRITNQGLGSDIRGTIGAVEGIGDITLVGGGSIIDAVIATVTNLSMLSPQNTEAFTIFDNSYISRITLSGNGGILGSYIASHDIGDVSVRGGFGIINTSFATPASGSLGNFYADGYGFRNVSFSTGRTMGSITAGQRSDANLAIASYTASARTSEFDPVQATVFNDLFMALDNHDLNTDYTYRAGIVYGIHGRGTYDLGTIRGYRLENLDLSYANSTTSLTADENIERLTLTTGKITSINAGSPVLRGDIRDSSITVAGDITSITVYGNIDNTDIVTSSNGTLGALYIRKASINSDSRTYAYEDGPGGFFYRSAAGQLLRAGANTSDLESIAVRGSDGAVFAVRYDAVNRVDQLVRVNPLTGAITVVGTLQNAGGQNYGTNTGSQVLGLAFDGNDLLVILQNGTPAQGGAAGATQPALARITTWADVDGFVRVDRADEGLAGPVTITGVAGQFSAMAVSNTGQILVVLDGNRIAEVDRETGTASVIQTFAGLNLAGLGFDHKGALLALDATTDAIYALNLDDGTTTLRNNVVDGIDAYAVGNVGGSMINGSSIEVAGRVNFINIQGDIDDSTITVLSGSVGPFALNQLILGGNLHGTLNLHHNVNQIMVAGSLGQSGDELVVHGNLNSLIVGSDRTTPGAELGLDLVVLGNLGVVNVYGAVTGDITVQGALTHLLVTADPLHKDGEILSGDVSVTEGIHVIQLLDGDLSGEIIAGRDILSLVVTRGDITDDALIQSTFGRIGTVMTTGDFDGTILAGVLGDSFYGTGGLTVLQVGGQIGQSAYIAARSIQVINVTKGIQGGADIIVDRLIGTIAAGYIGDSLSSVNITAGGVTSIVTRSVPTVNPGHFYGDLNLGNQSLHTIINVAGNFGGSALIDTDLTLVVRGDLQFGTAADNRLIIAGTANTINVLGDIAGAIFIENNLFSLVAGSLTDAIITVGGQANLLMVRGDVEDSLVQVGHWAGQDHTYASVDGEQDLGEQARRMGLLHFSAGSVTNSIIAAGGNINVASVTGAVTDSSISSGWSVGSLAINERLNGVTDGNLLRSQDGRELLSGNILQVLAGSFVRSYVSAGVDAGVGGDYSNPTVLYDNAGQPRPVFDGGGISTITVIRGTADVDTRIVADSGITSNLTGAVQVNANVTYALADLEAGNPLPASVGTAVQGSPLTYTDNGVTVTITVRGPGSVDLRDDVDTDGFLDGLVITGTTLGTIIDIKTSNPGQLNIGRILVEDDARIASFSFDGKVVGDGTAALDVWFDGGVTTLNLGGLGSNQDGDRFAGVIGGDVTSFTLGQQDGGLVRVAGTVHLMRVNAGSGDPLLLFQQDYAGYLFDGMTIEGPGVWAFRGDQLYTIDPFNNDNVTAVTVTDATLGHNLELLGLDAYAGPFGTELYAVAKLYSQEPTVALSGLSLDVHSPVVHPDGRMFAIRHDVDNNVDQLVQINPSTGAHTIIGTLHDGLFSTNYGSDNGTQVLALAFRSDGTLVALLSDQHGADGGPASLADDIALAEISLTANSNGQVAVKRLGDTTGTLPPRVLGTNTGESYAGLAFNTTGQLFAVRDGHHIVEIDVDPLSLTYGQDLASYDLGFGLLFKGIGFDLAGNLIGLDEVSQQLYYIELGGSPAATPLAQGSLPGLFTYFTIAHTAEDGGLRTYAMTGNQLYTNAGMAATLGELDPITGQFVQRLPLAQDIDGTPLTEGVVDITVDTRDPLLTYIKVLTESGRILTYNTGGQIDLGMPPIQITDPTVKLTTIDFDASGRLLGLNSLAKQIVVINPQTGDVSYLTEPGSVRGDVSILALDQVTGQGLVFNAADASVLSLAGMTQQAMGGLTATSITSLTLGDGYAGRVATVGGNLNVATLQGDFGGTLSVLGNVLSLTQTNGVFDGVAYASGYINSVVLRDADMLDSGVIWADGRLSLNILSGLNHAGLFDGKVVAGHLASLNTNGTQASHAEVIVTRQADLLTIGGDFAGSLDLANARLLTVNGALTNGASILSHGDVLSLTLRGGAQSNTSVAVKGAVTTFLAGQSFNGTLAVREGARSVTFMNLNQALVSIGLDTTIVTVQGNAVDSILSLGTWVGDDLAYNTFDDLITGGKVTSVTILGQYRNSVVAAGVLPTFRRQGFVPGTSSNFAFLGNPAASDLLDRDSAEAGGLLWSDIGLLHIRGEIISTNVNAGRVAGVASAGSLGRVITGQTGNILQQRVYSDPYGGVEPVDVNYINNQRLEIIFSEPLNTASISFVRDLDGDGLPFGPGELGSIALASFIGMGDVQIYSNLTASYSTRMIDGMERSVVTVTSTDTFTSDPFVFIMPGSASAENYDLNPVLFDRSGPRSAMMYFNGDPFGTFPI